MTSQLTDSLSQSVIDYLDGRASAYGGDYTNMLDITPDGLHSGSDIMEFWQDKHLSHIFPQSEYPSLAHDWNNIIPEDHDANLARGAEVMSPLDRLEATFDNHCDAQAIAGDWHFPLLDDLHTFW